MLRTMAPTGAIGVQGLDVDQICRPPALPVSMVRPAWFGTP